MEQEQPDEFMRNQMIGLRILELKCEMLDALEKENRELRKKIVETFNEINERLNMICEDKNAYK